MVRATLEEITRVVGEITSSPQRMTSVAIKTIIDHDWFRMDGRRNRMLLNPEAAEAGRVLGPLGSIHLDGVEGVRVVWCTRGEIVVRSGWIYLEGVKKIGI